ncbi:hypothetical protein AVEN_103035-1, partial [Araneus ventricosus]
MKQMDLETERTFWDRPEKSESWSDYEAGTLPRGHRRSIPSGYNGTDLTPLNRGQVTKRGLCHEAIVGLSHQATMGR